MPHMRLPKVKLGFLKKLLPRKPGPEPEPDVVQERTTNVHPGKQQVGKAKMALDESPLEECPICHDTVGVTNPEGVLESWVHLHCNHKFGTHCIQTWLQESAERDPHSIPSCPICRTTAKHPCGHPVIVPAHRLQPFTMWATMPSSPPAPPSPQLRGRRPRRRLSRRAGHPHRPPPPQLERVRVQTVGECAVCAATAAAQERRMKEMMAPSVETSVATTPYGGRGPNSGRRNGIKSMLLQASSRWTAPEHSRDENYTTFVDSLSERIAPVVPAPTITPLEYMNLCRTEIIVARSPTPAPVAHRAALTSL